MGREYLFFLAPHPAKIPLHSCGVGIRGYKTPKQRKNLRTHLHKQRRLCEEEEGRREEEGLRR
jgi:hypothetical protein